MNNSVASGVLDASGTYIPLWVSNNGTFYADFSGVRNILILLSLFGLFAYLIFLMYKKWKSINL
jgi:hypothetical protein